MVQRVREIAQAEGCTSPAEQALLDPLLEQADGDMRRAVTTLQSLHSLAVGGANVSVETLHDIVGQPSAAVVDQLWQAVATSQSFDEMQQVVESVCMDGYSARVLLAALLPKLVVEPDFDEMSKAKLSIRMAEAEKNMIEGASDYLQLMTFCSLGMTCFAESKRANHMEQ